MSFKSSRCRSKIKKKGREKDEEIRWDLWEIIRREQYTHIVNAKNRRERKGGESTFKTTVAEKNSYLGRKTFRLMKWKEFPIY